MKLIIDIADDQYKAVQDGTYCGSLYEELKNGITVEQCVDCIRRQDVEDAIYDYSRSCDVNYAQIMEFIDKLPSVTPQPCEDCVSRQEVLDLPRIKTHNVWGNVICESVDVDNVRQLPSVTPMPKMAAWEWNQYDGNPKIGNFHCSLCHNIGRTYFDYCPYCGAKMLEIPTGAEGSEKK